MARASTLNDSKIRGLLIGPAKAGKTHWTCEAAQAGFNLVYLDGDVGGQTIAMFDDETKSRIYYFPMGDDLDGPKFSKHVRGLFDATTSKPFIWNDTHKKQHSNLSREDLSECEVSVIDLRKMTMNDVLVIDSWTSLSYSAKDEVAKRCGDDLGEMEKADRGIYASSGNRLTKFLVTLQHLPCHVIVIAHPDEYVQEGKPTIQIPMSSSRPHANTMGKYFTDIGWMTVTATGKREIDFRPDPRRIVGGRLAGKKPTTEFSFLELVKKAGAPVPNPDAKFSAVVEYDKGTYIPKESSKPAGKVIDSSKKTANVGLGGLVTKPK